MYRVPLLADLGLAGRPAPPNVESPPGRIERVTSRHVDVLVVYENYDPIRHSLSRLALGRWFYPHR